MTSFLVLDRYFVMTAQTPVFPRHAKGSRPHFFDDPAIDQMLTFFVELTTEVSVLRDRVNTLERVLETNSVLDRNDVEAYRPDTTAEQERMDERRAFLKRVFRMHAEDPEAAV